MKRTLSPVFPIVIVSFATFCLTSVAFGQTVGGGIKQLHQWEGAAANNHFGGMVADAGDVNADGYSDIIVGSSEADPPGLLDAGSAFVYSGIDGSLLYRFDGSVAGGRFGSAVAGAGDINGDGFADLLVRGEDITGSFYLSGSVYAYSGANGALLHRWDGRSDRDTFGNSIAGAGDVDGDGFDDVIVGARWTHHLGFGTAGSAFVFSGATGNPIHQWNGSSNNASLGQAVSSAGDLNGDGYADLLVTAPFNRPGGGLMVGSAFAFSGINGSLLYQWDGLEEHDSMGWSVSNAGDVNNDGTPDIIVGAPDASPPGFSTGLWTEGAAYVFSGAGGSLLYHWEGGFAGARFGRSTSGAGDVNGDGFDDVIVSHYYASFAGLQEAGAALIYSGADGSVLRTLRGTSSESFFGWSVSQAGDVNGDGLDDVIVGAPFDDAGGLTSSGSASVFGFHPFMSANTSTVSASAGGILDFDLDFPAAASFDSYKVLISATGVGPSFYGVEIPLTRDALVVSTFLGNYPFATYANLHGTLDANAQASASITVPAGLQAGLIGRTFWLAAIANQAGQLPRYSSVAVAIGITQ